jgi:hypothetical protein
MLYRIDQLRGAVASGRYAVINGNKLQTDDTLLSQLNDMTTNNDDNNPSSLISDRSPDEIRSKLACLEDALQRSVVEGRVVAKKRQRSRTWKRTIASNNLRRILAASIHREEGMVLDQCLTYQ